ncbi:MAG TPA: DNA/RNA non-specific endonuclease [Candidatus Paceibacterota bacterium]|nr:DNA/RNA non-specific endonuclease [Verrucomicrobiota bacterium]HSA09838.1 DNA/RNA non-specific endonuclease [Candidatus Paceibacterota bacterium]
MFFHKPFPRKLLAILTGAVVLLSAVFPAGAIIDASLQMQLGNPSGATADTNNYNHYLIQRPVEAMDYNAMLGQPNWASWNFTSADTSNAVARSTRYFTDTSLPPNFYQVAYDDYAGSGWDRGHLCPSADRLNSRTNNDMVFLMSNMMPQAGDQNSGVWAQLESDCRAIAGTNNEMLIICGPSRFTGATIASGHVAVPAYTWKIAVVVPLGDGTALDRINYSTRVIAVTIPNSNSVAAMKWTNFVTSASALEAETGFTFFTALPPNLAAVLRSKVDGQAPPEPGIAGFAPTSGNVGISVTITGTNLNFTTNVTFGGTSASFTINSSSNLTATVPAGASSGPIIAATLGGTAASPGSFIVGTNGQPDLAIALTHTGDFTQGDIGATYTIIVTNAGTDASSGSVTVTTTLPAGLTGTAIGGTGWSADLGTLTCTRSDSLPAGTTYPAITLTVNVATNAPASVTNVATVAGGGETDFANNTASDPTTILPASTGGGLVTLVGWDVSWLPDGTNNFGPSPMAPTTNAGNLTLIGLTRGSSVGTNGSAANRAWGGNTWTNTSPETAIASNRFATFSVAANAGYTLSFASISKFDYRHSGTGPTNGLLQYQIGSGIYSNIAVLSYPSTSSAGDSVSPIDLSTFPDLQNVGAGTNVTFRIANWGATSGNGTWYIFDKDVSSAPDFAVQGTVLPAAAPVADLAIGLSHSGSFTQGDTGRSYSITVTNIGAGDTVGTVTVTNVLPAGLVATALSGSGWSADFGTLTCSRSDALPAGASYPPITVTVNVLTNAPASITNTATVLGGGEINLANNTASDPTTIIALAPVELWRLYWFGTTANAGAAADTAIATSDGMPNLLKYALGLDPLTPAVNPVVGDIDTGYLRLTVPRNPDATDVSFHVEVATDLLGQWSTNETTVDINTATLLQAHYNTPVASSDRAFIRLRVSRP